MFIILGLAFAWKATSYSMGTAARMGPGYFPYWLGIIMAGIGAIVLLTSFSKMAEETEIAKFDFKILAIICVSVLAFAVMLRPLGLLLSIMAVVLISSTAGHDHNWKTTVINAVCLTVLCWAAFVKGLKLVFPIWPAFLGMN
jgi:hypothetical protein